MVKEVQSLTEKLAALTRFLSKAAERQFPFFKTLKGCLKQKNFVWSSEADSALQEMKKLLKTLPTLTAPIHGEVLYLYISVANEAFGSILIAERNKIQKPLVANQFSGSFEAHDPSMQKYLQLLKETVARFEHFELAQVPRSQNKKADALSKLAALTFSHFQKQVWVKELPSKSIESDLMVTSLTEEQPNWMEPILKYIRSNILPEDSREARSVRERAPMYIIQDDILYRKSYCGPMMRCVGPIEAEMIVEENRMPWHDMIPVNSTWPFNKWAIDIVGPFPAGPGNVKFLIVAFDYFTKWVEAKAVRTIIGVQVRNFVWEYIVCRFGIPRELVSDNGTQIAKDPFKTWCADLNIIQKFTSVAYPQANGLCKVTNRDIR
ncbi:uncharacterized protein [Rutidosis leptorrhynchoides]|uniref:uncharacterized protein n=1 Tax=Rutidosis leptorrhynchoides TaxID=125765 RepID=UPI003A997DF5